MFNIDNKPTRNTSSKNKLRDASDITSALVYGATASSIESRDKEVDNLIGNILDSAIKNNFGNTSKPLEYFSMNMLNDLWNKTDKKGFNKKKDFEEIMRQYVSDNNGLDTTKAGRTRYENYRNIYSHIPAAHVSLNIYKTSILSPESLTDEPINFSYKDKDDNIRNVMESRVKNRIIKKYKLNEEMDAIVKEALIDGVSYRAIISIEKDMESMLKDSKILNENAFITFDEDYTKNKVVFKDSDFTDSQVEDFNRLLKESAQGYIDTATAFANRKNISSEQKDKAKLFLENVNSIIKPDTPTGKYSKKDIGNLLSEAFDNNVILKSKYDFMEDYTAALNEGYEIGYSTFDEEMTSTYNESYETSDNKTGKLYLNGSKIIRLAPEKVTPIKIGGITIGYIYTEKESGLNAAGGDVNMGMTGTADLTQMGPSAYGMSAFGPSGAGGNMHTNNQNMTNPLGMMNTQQAGSNAIVDMFINGLGKKLNKNFIKNNKELKELIHELLREKYITQRKVAITFFSSDDVVETRYKPLFEGAEFFAKLYLAELTNNITTSLGRGMDRRMIKIPFGLDDDMHQSVQDAIRTFKTREFSMSSIDDTTISSLIRLSPGRYEDMYVPVGTDGVMGYEIEILPGLDNQRSSELLPQLKNQFLDSINIPANAIDSTVETDFSRSIALRNVYFSKEVVDYQKPTNETITQIIRKIYTDEYKYNGNKLNNEPGISLDNFKAWFSKPYSLNISTTLETMQMVDQYANMVVAVVVDMSDPTNNLPAHLLRKKIFKDTMSYLEWSDWESAYEEYKTKAKINKVKNSAKKGDPNDDDPNNFNPGGFTY